ncbi:transposase [Kineococcus sp. SYSU DK005]|uniref:transposase n=1 Tax=Kineococcus sp. SYSU DK005 TaxID=3383126 RepID=UPI003D7E6BDA
MSVLMGHAVAVAVEREAYPSDLSDAEWQLIEPLLPKQGRMGRPRQDLREVLNGIFYVVDNGAKWRAMPHDLPPWETCYRWMRRLEDEGTWQKLVDEVRVLDRMGKDAPSRPACSSSTPRASAAAKAGTGVPTTRARRSTGASG